MSDYDDESVTNNLRDSENGTFVTLDDSSHLTGDEPNAMELINDTELNNSVPSNFTNFQDSLVHNHDMDDKVKYTFIQNRFHPQTHSSKHDVIQ